MRILRVIVVIYYFSLFCYQVNSNVVRSKSSKLCKSNRVAMYNVTFVGNWSPELFPKHYPEFRPPAQWSKTFGESRYVSFRPVPFIYHDFHKLLCKKKTFLIQFALHFSHTVSHKYILCFY